MGFRTGKVLEKNLTHLNIICQALNHPTLGQRQLNVLYALRSAWAVRGYFVDAELRIIKETTSAPISKVEARRVAQLTTQLKAEVIAAITPDVEIPLPSQPPQPPLPQVHKKVKKGGQ